MNTTNNIVIRLYESPSMKIAEETPLYKLLVNNVEASTQLMELIKVFQDDVRRETYKKILTMFKRDEMYTGVFIHEILTNLDTISHELHNR